MNGSTTCANCGMIWSHFGAIWSHWSPTKNRKKPRYHTFASTQDARRFAYSFDCRNEGGYEPARIAEACKMTFQDFVMLGINTKDGPPSYPLVNIQIAIENGPFGSFIYLLKIVIFHSYVSLPEGISGFKNPINIY